jgi:hypothetical protein
MEGYAQTNGRARDEKRGWSILKPLCLAVYLLLVSPGIFWGGTQPYGQVVPLLGGEASLVSTTATFPDESRHRWARSNPSAFDDWAATFSRSGRPLRLSLQLFDGLSVHLVLERPFPGQNALGGWGEVAGYPGSWVVWSWGERRLFAEISIPGVGSYEVRSVTENVVRLTEKDASKSGDLGDARSRTAKRCRAIPSSRRSTIRPIAPMAPRTPTSSTL